MSFREQGTPKSSSLCPAYPVYLDSLTLRAAHSECFRRSELSDSGWCLGWKCLDDQYSERNRIKIFKSTTGIQCSKYFKWIISFSPKRGVFFFVVVFLFFFCYKSQGQITYIYIYIFFFSFLKEKHHTMAKRTHCFLLHGKALCHEFTPNAQFQ